MVRDDDRVGAGLDGLLGVARIHDAFQDQLALPLIADPLHVAPVQRWIELRCVQAPSELVSATPVTWPTILPNERRLVDRISFTHLGLVAILRILTSVMRGSTEAILHVTMALPEHLQVHVRTSALQFAAAARASAW